MEGGGEAPVVSDDPALASLAASLLPALSEVSGLPPLRPVRVEWRSREALLDHVSARLDRDLPPERAAAVTRAYALLGLVPDTLDLRDLLARIYREQVAGFYDPDAAALFVLDDQSPGALEPLLLHELVHAIQDQHLSLDSLTGPHLGNDRRLAARAAIEGHATLVMMAWSGRGRRGGFLPPEELPDLEGLLRPDPSSLASQYPALAEAPRVIRESLLFPYVDGAAHVQRLWRSLPGRPPPFDTLLPSSTRAILFHPAAGALPVPVEVRVPVPEGEVVRLEDTLGALEAGVFMERWAGEVGSLLARSLRGDRWVLSRDIAGRDWLRWGSAWDSVEHRDRFVDALRPHLSRFPAPAVVDEVELDGAPGAILRIGPSPVGVEGSRGGES